MESSHSKITLKLGLIEVDYEGDVTFLKTDLVPLLKELCSLPLKPEGLKAEEPIPHSVPTDHEEPPLSSPTEGTQEKLNLSFRSMFSDLEKEKYKTTLPNKICAAAYYLQKYNQKSSYTKDDIKNLLNEASLFTASDASNWSTAMSKATKSSFTELADKTIQLKQNKFKELDSLMEASIQ